MWLQQWRRLSQRSRAYAFRPRSLLIESACRRSCRPTLSRPPRRRPWRSCRVSLPRRRRRCASGRSAAVLSARDDMPRQASEPSTCRKDYRTVPSSRRICGLSRTDARALAAHCPQCSALSSYCFSYSVRSGAWFVEETLKPGLDLRDSALKPVDPGQRVGELLFVRRLLNELRRPGALAIVRRRQFNDLARRMAREVFRLRHILKRPRRARRSSAFLALFAERLFALVLRELNLSLNIIQPIPLFKVNAFQHRLSPWLMRPPPLRRASSIQASQTSLCGSFALARRFNEALMRRNSAEDSAVT